MYLNTFIRLAQGFNNLGWAVQEQLVAVLTDGNVEDQNPNALRMIADYLETVKARSAEDEVMCLEIDEVLELITDRIG